MTDNDVKLSRRIVDKKKIVRYVLITILTFSIVFFFGWLSDDKYYLGSITLCFGVIQVTLMMKGTWVAEVLALCECVAGIAIYVFNGLWGTVIFSFLVYIPLNVYGIYSWKKNQVDGVIEIKALTLKKFWIIFLMVVVSTSILSLLLSLIPSQNFSILDSLVNVLNICGIVLLNLCHKEGWFFWMACNVVESITWITLIILGVGSNAIMMLVVCCVYIVLDIIAYKSFVKINKNQTAFIIKKNN